MTLHWWTSPSNFADNIDGSPLAASNDACSELSIPARVCDYCSFNVLAISVDFCQTRGHRVLPVKKRTCRGRRTHTRVEGGREGERKALGEDDTCTTSAAAQTAAAEAASVMKRTSVVQRAVEEQREQSRARRLERCCVEEGSCNSRPWNDPVV